MNHLRTIRALFKKDIKDTGKNANVLILLLLPVFFCVLYNLLDFGGEVLPPEFVLQLSVLMSLCLIPTSFLASIIAEEKEKNTLRTLTLSGVTGGEFLCSKALVTFLYMQGVNLVIFFVTGQPVDRLLWFFVCTTLTSVCMIFVGAFAGLLSKDQMSTSMIVVPFMLVFLIPPMFSGANDVLGTIAKFLPTAAMIRLYFQPDRDFALNFTVILGWALAVLAVFLLIFRKRKLDN